MKYTTCNLCGADRWSVRYPSTLNGALQPDVSAFRCTSPSYGYHSQIVQCQVCGFVYTNPRWEAADVLSAYAAVEDAIYVDEREGRERTFQHHLARLEKMTGPPAGRRLLDVGAYIGVFVEVAQAAGWEAYGIEPSTWAVAEAHRRGLRVWEGTQASLAAASVPPFDVITMWDVIEHFDDPLAELHQAYTLLKPGGLIVIHTMNVDSLTARLMGPRWPWLMSMHIHYFSPRTLGQMVERTGFRPARQQTEGRYLRLGYLATRLAAVTPRLGSWVMWAVQRLGVAEVMAPVNFGDLFTLYAVRQ